MEEGGPQRGVSRQRTSTSLYAHLTLGTPTWHPPQLGAGGTENYDHPSRATHPVKIRWDSGINLPGPRTGKREEILDANRTCPAIRSRTRCGGHAWPMPRLCLLAVFSGGSLWTSSRCPMSSTPPDRSVEPAACLSSLTVRSIGPLATHKSCCYGRNLQIPDL